MIRLFRERVQYYFYLYGRANGGCVFHPERLVSGFGLPREKGIVGKDRMTNTRGCSIMNNYPPPLPPLLRRFAALLAPAAVAAAAGLGAAAGESG